MSAYSPSLVTALFFLFLTWRFWAHTVLTTVAEHCAALHEPLLQHFDVHIPNMQVPEDAATSYVCQAFKIPFPIEKDFHSVAFQPLIGNHDVMHHMILFSCDGHDIPQEFLQPHQCGTSDNLCRSWMAQWSMGVEGVICPHNETGVRFGKSVGLYLLLQIHWNNEDLKAGLTDNSGMRVFYSPKLRPYDLGHVQVGQQNVVIPPGVTRHVQSGGCSSQCTNILLPQPIHITTAHLHMHYLGAGGWLEIVHSDGNITQVIQDDNYNFSHPTVYQLQSPVIVRPGDYLRLTCLFSSKLGSQQRTETIYFGEGSDGEMCYAFLAYYPKIQGFDQCLELGMADINCPSASNTQFRECTSKFPSQMTSQYLANVLASCQTGDKELLCNAACKQSLNAIYNHSCMQGSLGDYIQRQILPTLTAWQKMEELHAMFFSMCGKFSIM